MGASFLWQSVKPNHLSVGPRDFFRTMFERIFGDLPRELDKSDLERLHIAEAAWPHEGSNPFEDLSENVEKHGLIRVWVEY